jgi:hypothetical protein
MVGPGGYRSPPMPWYLDPGDQPSLLARHPELAEVRDLRLPRGRGRFWGVLAPLLAGAPVIRRVRPAVVLALARPSSRPPGRLPRSPT